MISVISDNYLDVMNGNPLHLRKVYRRPAMVYTRAYLYTCVEINTTDTALEMSEEVNLNILARHQDVNGEIY